MKIKWLIQDVVLGLSQVYRKFDALYYMEQKISGIGVMHDYPYITGLDVAIEEDIETKYVLLVGIKVLNLLKAAKNISDVVENPTDFQLENSDIILKALINGIYYDFEKFDQAFYGKLDLPLLNHNAIYIPIKDNLKTYFDHDKFIKPSRDLKAFDAGILKAGQTVEDFILSKKRQNFFMEELLVVSDVLDIASEYRFFIVDDKVVAGSGYRYNNVVKEDANVPDYLYRIANEYKDLYKPADIFTMDLALLKDNSVKIIEYNCFNCSGVYLCDLVKTFSAINNYLLKK